MKKTFAFLVVWRVSACLVLLDAADWPQLAGNPQRTGFSSDKTPPMNSAFSPPLWAFNLDSERICPLVQPIIAEGKVFFGSRQGVMRALDAATGAELWQAKAERPIIHTAAYRSGKVYFAGLDGKVRCLEASSGKPVWTWDAGYPGFSTGLLLAEEKLFAAGRDGRLYAWDADSGAPLWTYDAGIAILNSPAYNAGRVFFGSEDMRMHAVDAATGRQAWRSEKLYGQSMRQYWPVVAGGKVCFHVMSLFFWVNDWSKALHCQRCLWENYEKSWQNFQETVRGPVLERRKTKDKPDEQDIELEQEALRAWMAAFPYVQTFYVLDEATGKQAYIAPVMRNRCNNGPMPPPVVMAENLLYTPFFSSWWPSKGGAEGVFNLELGRIERVIRPDVIMDQTVAFSNAGGQILESGDFGNARRFWERAVAGMRIKADNLGGYAPPAVAGGLIVINAECNIIAGGKRP